MNKIFPLLGLLLLGGCISMPQMEKADSTVESVAVGVESHARISDVFFSSEIITGNEYVGYPYVYNGSASKIELTVAGATNDKLTLNYAEYTKPQNEYGSFLKDGDWIIKSAFNSQYQYDLTTSKTVAFKGFEFQVLGVKDNTVIYRRTK